MSGRIELHMGMTKTATVRHLTVDDSRSLCGLTLERIVKNQADGTPIPYADHWAPGSVGPGGMEVCGRCLDKRPR